ncbi:hypothetical protein [Lactovum odontotermitis]
MKQQDALNSGNAAKYNFSQNIVDKDGNITTQGGTNLPNDGIVYLQPAIKTLTPTYTSLPNPNDSYYNPKIFREAAA